MTVAERSIIIVGTNGTRQIVSGVPGNAKITYGPVQPGGKGDYGHRENVLRIYTTTNNQLAVFRNVDSFRDLSLKVQVEEVEVDTRVKEKHGPDGSQSSRRSRAQSRMVDDSYN